MSEEAIIELGRQAVWVMLKVGAPGIVVALVVGLLVSLVQALTQIQEMTLTFVPKLVAMLGAMILAAPYMIDTLIDFSEQLYQRIGGLGGVG